jgi:pSer/pThr/pTyr-binding forkhead associated (FHA) protein
MIRIKHGDDKYDIELGHEPFTVGRSSKNDLKINDPKLSGIHCSFRVHNGKATVKDLDSSNGTYLDNIIVEESFINIEQKIKVGNVTVYLLEDKMTNDEYSLHTTGDQKPRMVVDINEGLAEKSEVASQVFAKNKQSRIMVNRKHLKKDEEEMFEVEKSTHMKNVEKIQKPIARESLRKGDYNKKYKKKKGLLDKILSLFK